MSLQINTFDDLLYIVEHNPEWRRQLVKALFPEIDLPKALQELVESNRLLRSQLGDVEAILKRMDERLLQTEVRLNHIEDRQTLMEDRQTRMEDRQTRMENRLDRIDLRLTNVEGSVATLKGDSYENMISKKADAIFGYILRRSHDGRNEIGIQLDTAEQSGQISADEFTQVLSADLLWSGRLKQSAENTTLVVEVSWFSEQNDLQRASERAAILRKIGINAIPVVAAREWTKAIQQTVQSNHIVAVQEFNLDKSTLENALANE